MYSTDTDRIDIDTYEFTLRKIRFKAAFSINNCKSPALGFIFNAKHAHPSIIFI